MSYCMKRSKSTNPVLLWKNAAGPLQALFVFRLSGVDGNLSDLGADSEIPSLSINCLSTVFDISSRYETDTVNQRNNAGHTPAETIECQNDVPLLYQRQRNRRAFSLERLHSKI